MGSQDGAPQQCLVWWPKALAAYFRHRASVVNAAPTLALLASPPRAACFIASSAVSDGCSHLAIPTLLFWLQALGTVRVPLWRTTTSRSDTTSGRRRRSSWWTPPRRKSVRIGGGITCMACVCEVYGGASGALACGTAVGGNLLCDSRQVNATVVAPAPVCVLDDLQPPRWASDALCRRLPSVATPRRAYRLCHLQCTLSFFLASSMPRCHDVPHHSLPLSPTPLPLQVPAPAARPALQAAAEPAGALHAPHQPQAAREGALGGGELTSPPPLSSSCCCCRCCGCSCSCCCCCCCCRQLPRAGAVCSRFRMRRLPSAAPVVCVQITPEFTLLQQFEVAKLSKLATTPPTPTDVYVPPRTTPSVFVRDSASCSQCCCWPAPHAVCGTSGCAALPDLSCTTLRHAAGCGTWSTTVSPSLPDVSCTTSLFCCPVRAAAGAGVASWTRTATCTTV